MLNLVYGRTNLLNCELLFDLEGLFMFYDVFLRGGDGVMFFLA